MLCNVLTHNRVTVHSEILASLTDMKEISVTGVKGRGNAVETKERVEEGA